jgi:hypothetical protein
MQKPVRSLLITVEIVMEYLVSLNNPCYYMMQCPESIYSRLSWYKSHLSQKHLKCNHTDFLTLLYL